MQRLNSIGSTPAPRAGCGLTCSWPGWNS